MCHHNNMVWFARQGSGGRSEGDLICDNYLGGPTTELRVRRELRTEGGLTQQSGLFGVFLLSRELLSYCYRVILLKNYPRFTL